MFPGGRRTRSLGALCLPEPCYVDERPLVSRSPARPEPGCVKTAAAAAAAPLQRGRNRLRTHTQIYAVINNIFHHCNLFSKEINHKRVLQIIVKLSGEKKGEIVDE